MQLYVYRQFAAQLGVFDLKNQKSENWTERNITETSAYPDFGESSGAIYYDVAVLTLEYGVVFSNNIRPICLPDFPSSEPNHISVEPLSVSGWGKAYNETSETLKTERLQIYKER